MAETALVAVLPPKNLLKALYACAAIPATATTPTGRDLVKASVVYQQQIDAKAQGGIALTWPKLRIEGSADAGPLETALGAAGVPASLVEQYLAVWQAGAVILVIRPIPAALQTTVRAALAPFLRPAPTSGPESTSGAGMDEAPAFAVFSPGAQAIPANLEPKGVDLPTPTAPPPTAGEEPESAPAAPPVVQRFADVRAPVMALPEQVFPLTVALTRQAPPDLPNARALNVRVTQTAAGATGAAPVSVIVYATAFEIIGQARQNIEIFADKDSDPLTFPLRSRPGVNGEQQISVTLVQGLEILGRVIAKVTVGTAVPMVGYSMPIEGTSPPGAAGSPAAPPHVILHVDRVVAEGRDHLHFQYMWPQNDELALFDAGSIEVNNVETWARDQYADLSKRAHFEIPAGPPDDPAGRGALKTATRALEKVGEGLYDMLFPQPLKDFYKRFAPRAKTILIYSTEPWIPWELVKPYGLDIRDEDCDFLCARFQVARWLTDDRARRVPRQVTLRAICPVIPPSNLPAAQQERAYITALPQHWTPLALYPTLPRTADEVLAAMASGQVNLFHIATHGNFSPDDPNKATLQLGRDQLTPADLTSNPVLRGLDAARPLVFLNACHSGRQGLALSGLGGWVDQLLREGCSGFIGTNWEVHDDLAAAFAIKFYDTLSQGKTFGEACQQARRHIRELNPGNSTWLAYVLYAHPLGTLQAGA